MKLYNRFYIEKREGILRKLYLFLRCIPKTLYFNFKYLPFNKAIKFPILVSHRVWLMETKGKVILNTNNIVLFVFYPIYILVYIYI